MLVESEGVVGGLGRQSSRKLAYVDPIGYGDPSDSAVRRALHERAIRREWGPVVHDVAILWVDQHLADFRADRRVGPPPLAGESNEVELILTNAKAAMRIAGVQSHIVEKEITQVALFGDGRRVRPAWSGAPLDAAIAYKRRRPVAIEVRVDGIFV